MLKKFAVTNFKGFRDRIELDLSKPRSYEFNDYALRDGIIKDAIIYGPNGSGKSNLGLAVFDIINHLSTRMKMPQYYVSSVYAGAPDRPMYFEYTFLFDGNDLEYRYAKNSKSVLIEEELLEDGKTVFRRDGSSFFLDQEEFPMVPEKLEVLRENSNNISIINNLLISYPLDKNHYLNRLTSFVDSMLWFRSLEERGFMGLKTQSEILEEFIIDNNLTDDFSAFLSEVSGQSYTFVPPQKGDRLLICRIGDSSVPFDAVRSTGTSSLTLLYYWLNNLNGASLVFIDNFDALYHYSVSTAACRRLFSLDCQVILASHNTWLMTNELLRPDCNFLLENNAIRPLSDCTDRELRLGHNIEKMYRGRAFNT